MAQDQKTTCFFVAGIPVPKGSAKAFLRPGAKIPTVMQDNAEKQKPWSSSIGYAAQQAGVTMAPKGQPVKIDLIFYFPRPKGHYGTGKNAETLKASAPANHVTKPDLDKLVRCVLDALTGIAWNDDAQVQGVFATKWYGDAPGVEVEIEACEWAIKPNKTGE